MAKIALIVVSILATLFVNGINCKDDEERDKVRLRVNALAIAQLERHIESSEVKLKKAKIAARSQAAFITDVKYRLKKLEGSVCEWNEFECGDDKYECVSELLACDGVKDCTNGGDEDPGFCDTSGFSASTVYSSWTPISKCIPAPKTSVYFTNHVLSVKRSKIFPPLLRTVQRGQGELFGKNVSMIAHGYIMIGTRRAVSFSKLGEGGSHCQYVDNSFDRMYCDSYSRGSTTPCMKNVQVNKHYG